TSSLKRSAAMVGVSTAAGAGLGAVSAPLLSSLGRVAQSAASVLLWPHAPAPTGTAGLLQTMVGGALVGAVTFGTFHTALVGGFHVADLLSPTRVEGELEEQNGRLTFKIPEAKHAIDLKTHAEAKQTTWGNSNQWWEEVEQDAIGQSAGYPGHLDF
ncbi:MAG: hypothetical protein KC800_33215, partial [Candidatus Eremiobacteraeota bacterium]|nr:hypothetical protein [Candidatus Eremiobacteraeota bacterium]